MLRSRRFPHFIAPFYKKRRKFGKKSSQRIDGCVRGFTITSSLRGFNPLTPGTFCKKRVFLDILVTFRLDPGRITFNSVENGHQHRALGHCDSGMRRNQNFEIVGRESDLRRVFKIFVRIYLSPFPFLLFSSFCCSD